MKINYKNDICTLELDNLIGFIKNIQYRIK